MGSLCGSTTKVRSSFKRPSVFYSTQRICRLVNVRAPLLNFLNTYLITDSKCKELHINGADMSCTDENRYKSVCTIQCVAGRRRIGPAKQICRGLQVPSWQGVDEIGDTKCGSYFVAAAKVETLFQCKILTASNDLTRNHGIKNEHQMYSS